MTTFSGILVSNHSKATILENNYKEVIDHVWQIVYRDFLDSNGKFERSNWINLRKDFLAKKYSDNNEAYDAIRDCLLYTSPSPRDATLSRMPSSA